MVAQADCGEKTWPQRSARAFSLVSTSHEMGRREVTPSQVGCLSKKHTGNPYCAFPYPQRGEHTVSVRYGGKNIKMRGQERTSIRYRLPFIHLTCWEDKSNPILRWGANLSYRCSNVEVLWMLFTDEMRHVGRESEKEAHSPHLSQGEEEATPSKVGCL